MNNTKSLPLTSLRRENMLHLCLLSSGWRFKSSLMGHSIRKQSHANDTSLSTPIVEVIIIRVFVKSMVFPWLLVSLPHLEISVTMSTTETEAASILLNKTILNGFFSKASVSSPKEPSSPWLYETRYSKIEDRNQKQRPIAEISGEET